MTGTTSVEREMGNEGQHYSVWFTVILWATVQVATFFMGIPSIFEGELIGPDSYMRMQRVVALNETWEWFDNTVPRANAPYGEALQHWSRPMDVLILVLSWPFRLWLDAPRALFTSAALVSPLLQLTTLFVLMGMARFFGGGDRRVSLGILFLLQPGLVPLFYPGRPDHHSLILFLFSLSVTLALRLVVMPLSRPVALLAGVVSALGLWVSSVENAVTLPATLAVMGLFWTFSGRDLGSKGYYFALAFLAVTTLALLLERPASVMWEPQFDRVSVIHWTICALVLVYWFGARAVELKEPTAVHKGRRLVFSAVWLVVATGVLLILFPQFLRGPLAEVAPETMAFLEGVQEMQPLVSWKEFKFGPLIYWMGTTFLLTPYLLWLIFRGADLIHRPAWIVILLYMMVFVPLPLLQIRWTGYTLFLTLFPYSELLTRVLAKVSRIGGELPRSFARAVTLVGFCLLPVAAGQMVMALEGSSSRAGVSTEGACAPRLVAEYLNDTRVFGPRPRTVLAEVSFGPELLHWSRHRVVGVPYHTSPSIPDTRRFFDAKDPAVAREIVTRRAVDVVHVCAEPGEAEFARRHGASNLRQRLLIGELPDWLTELALPPELGGSHRLYVVTNR